MNELEKKLQAINKEQVLAQIARDVVPLGQVPTGINHLDLLTGGGWPLGRVVVLYGTYGTAKSTAALWAVANAQKQGLNCLWIDVEKSFEAGWAKDCGVDVDNLPVIKTRSLESILKASQPLVPDANVIVIDSISTVQTEKYLDKDDGGIAIQARATKELLAKLEHWNNNALIIIISQLTTIFKGTHAVSSFTGGNALKHAASYIVKFWYNNDDRIKAQVKSGDRLINSDFAGMDIHWKLEKARASTTGSEGKFRFISGVGNDVRLEILELAVLKGVVDRAGKWIKYGERKWDGSEAFITDLEDPELFHAIRDEIFAERGE